MQTIAGRFRIDGEPLGRGGTGVVWPAVDEVTGAPVAVKLLHPELTGDPAALARLQEAVAVVGRVDHPHVVKVLGLWADAPGRWALVTERVDGISLEAVGAPLTPQAVAALLLELVSALEAVHAAGLVHGDLRPGNVLVGSGGARLFDFGSGGWVHPGQTPPEVADGAPRVASGDLYGLGVVGWFALTGRRPFEGSPAEALAAQRSGAPRAPGRGGLWELVRLLLHADPTRRPTDLESLRAALARLRAAPERRLRLRRPLAPFRPGREFVVHGVDPATGSRAVVMAGVSRRVANRTVRHLRGQGWRVQAHPEALGWSDLLLVGGAAVACGVVLPVVGFPLGGWLAWRYGSTRTFPGLRRALPTLSAPLPPRRLPAGTESAVVAGVLLLATALLLALQSWVAAVPAGLLLALAAWSWLRTTPDPARAAEHANLRSALAEIRWLIDHRAPSLDDALALTGEVGELEAVWLDGSADPRRVLARLDSIAAGLRDGASDREPATVTAVTPSSGGSR